MSYPASGEEKKKYSENIKLGRALKVVECDVFFMEIHNRLTKLEEENKKLHEGLIKKDNEINELRKKLESQKVEVSGTDISEVKSWSSFFDKGESKIKPTEEEMV